MGHGCGFADERNESSKGLTKAGCGVAVVVVVVVVVDVVDAVESTVVVVAAIVVPTVHTVDEVVEGSLFLEDVDVAYPQWDMGGNLW